MLFDFENLLFSGRAVNQFDLEFGFVEMLGEELDHSLIRLAVDGRGVHSHREAAVLVLGHRFFFGIGFDGNTDFQI